MNLIIVKMDAKLHGNNEGADCVVDNSLVSGCEVLATHLVHSYSRGCSRGILHVLNCDVVSIGNIVGLCGAYCGYAGAYCSSSAFCHWASVSTASYPI